MLKIDLHTHSSASPDGGLRPRDYQKALASGALDYIAITDHNTVDQAIELRKSLGDHIIVGEEIMTREGEVIGLYLHKTIPAGLQIEQTIAAIREQGGLVYIPHPFETLRKGVPLEVLDSIAEQVDIIETHNGRAVFQKKLGNQADKWASAHHVSGAASSDAHGSYGWLRTYTVIDGVPSSENLVELLQKASYQTGFPGVRGVLYPKLNRLRRKTGHA